MMVAEEYFCLGCGYCLKNLTTHRCPECGRAFDPARRETTSVSPKRVGPRLLRLLRVPAWPLAALSAAVMLAQFWQERLAPDGPTWGARWMIIAWGVLATGSLLAAGIVLLAVVRRVPAAYRPKRAAWRVALCLMPPLAWWGSRQHAGFWSALYVSRPALEHVVAEANDTYPRFDWPSRWVGVFPAQMILSDNDTTLIVLPSGTALLHSASGNPAERAVQLGFVPVALGDGKWSIAHGGSWDDREAAAQFHDAVFSELFAAPTARAMPFLIEQLRDNHAGFSNEAIVPRTDSVLPISWTFEALGWGDGNDQVEMETGSHGQALRMEWQIIGRLGKDAVEPLRREIAAHPKTARVYVGALGLVGPEALPAAEQVAGFLRDSDPWTRATAAWALRQIDPGGSQRDALLAALNDVDATVSFNVLLALDRAEMPPALRLHAYADYWARHAAVETEFAKGAIPPREERHPPYMDYAPPTPSNAEVQAIIGRHLLQAGAVDDEMLSSIVRGLESVRARYQEVGGTKESQLVISGMPIAEARAHESEAAACRMLVATGAPARRAVPALEALVAFRLRAGGSGAEITSGTTTALVDAVTKLDPTAPAQIAGLCVACIQADARMPLYGAPRAVTRVMQLPEWQLGWARSQTLGQMTAVAELLARLDPKNQAIRETLAAYLRQNVDASEHSAALEIGHFFLADDPALTTGIQAAITRGDADALRAGLHAASRLKALPAAMEEAIARRAEQESERFTRWKQDDLADELLTALLRQTPHEPRYAAVLVPMANANLERLRIVVRRYEREWAALPAEQFEVLLRLLGGKGVGPAGERLSAALPELVQRLNLMREGLQASKHERTTEGLFDAVLHPANRDDQRDAVSELLWGPSSGGETQPARPWIPPDLTPIRAALRQIASTPFVAPPLFTATASPGNPPGDFGDPIFVGDAIQLLMKEPWSPELQQLLEANLDSTCAPLRDATLDALSWEPVNAGAFDWMKRRALAKPSEHRLVSLVIQQGAPHPLTASELNSLLTPGYGEWFHYDETDIQAILAAHAADVEKAGWLWDAMRDNRRAALEALQKLDFKADNEEFHQDLLHAAYGDADERVRAAARVCLRKFFR